MKFSDIDEGILEDTTHSGILDGMCDLDAAYSIGRGINILNSYDAEESEPYPTGGVGCLSFGTKIPLSMEDQEELYENGWYKEFGSWPPDNDFVEKYGFNTIQVNL